MMVSIEAKFGPYKRPTQITIPKFEAIQEKTLELAHLIQKLCPPCDEKLQALMTLKNVRMMANESIAIFEIEVQEEEGEEHG